MSRPPLPPTILHGLFHAEDATRLLTEADLLDRMMHVEIALAWACEDAGVAPTGAGERIETALAGWRPDPDALLEGSRRSGVAVPALVTALRERIGGDEARYVHFGATTQDIQDTALVLQLRDVLMLIEVRIHAWVQALASLAREHRHTLMCGRTHGQVALPVTFGLKVCRWLAPFIDHLDRLNQLRPRLLVLQFSGGVGTLSALGGAGFAVEAALARRLSLPVPPCSWHTRRDGMVELAGWLSLVTGSLGKVGQDLILLSQDEVAEVSESADPIRGGSSTMPQKANPVRSELLVAAARHNATLVSGLHHAQIQEHERGTHGWQVEWLTLPSMVEITAGALRNALALVGDLVVRCDRMRDNVDASGGTMLAEAAALFLARYRPHDEASALVREAAMGARASGEHLVAVLAATAADGLPWEELGGEADHLGSTQGYIDRVLESVGRIRIP